jgi:hypothetical protein
MASINPILNLGLDLQVRLIKRIGIITSIDFLVSKATFGGISTYSIESYSYAGGPPIYETGSKPINFSKNISLFNFNVGLSYALH